MNVNQANEESIKKAIEIVGGANKLAKEIGVSYHTILAWKNGRTGMTVNNCIKIESATDKKVNRKDILPDFPWDEPQVEENKELEIAKNLLAAGVDVDTIVKTTGISAEELKKI